jgi:hypothetical protein
MPTDFSYCPRIKVDGRSLLSGAFGFRMLSSDASKLKMSTFENDVIRVLKKVYDTTWTATAVIDAVFKEGQSRNMQVMIIPMGASSTLASAGADDQKDAAPKDAERFRGLRDDPSTTKDERFEKSSGKGTGKGSSSHIEFDPNAEDAEKTIVHELLHSLREMRGQLNQVPTEAVLDQYENEEEFYAMLIGNIYLSEIGRTDLRASHIVYQELEESQKTSAGFLANTPYGKACRRLVYKFTVDEADVSDMVKNHVLMATKFNPIREFLTNTSKYPLG